MVRQEDAKVSAQIPGRSPPNSIAVRLSSEKLTHGD